jgi:hypothetical protein
LARHESTKKVIEKLLDTGQKEGADDDTAQHRRRA